MVSDLSLAWNCAAQSTFSPCHASWESRAKETEMLFLFVGFKQNKTLNNLIGHFEHGDTQSCALIVI